MFRTYKCHLCFKMPPNVIRITVNATYRFPNLSLTCGGCHTIVIFEFVCTSTKCQTWHWANFNGIERNCAELKWLERSWTELNGNHLQQAEVNKRNRAALVQPQSLPLLDAMFVCACCLSSPCAPIHKVFHKEGCAAECCAPHFEGCVSKDADKKEDYGTHFEGMHDQTMSNF